MATIEDDDFLDLADDYGHVVEPEAGIEGFVDFGFGAFLNFCTALVERARAEEGPRFTIANAIDYALAMAMLVALDAQLSRVFDGRDWDPENRYVASYHALKEGVRAYEQSVMLEVEQVQ
jgi:hypothetical protein